MPGRDASITDQNAHCGLLACEATIHWGRSSHGAGRRALTVIWSTVLPSSSGERSAAARHGAAPAQPANDEVAQLSALG
ncbi:hypothetical protein [Streptomyces coeruleorubidus]|uniref:hypothetical protein n=1 Tax=Streptomyces coeruleorubidus TaxID=116188 RepID=UPI00364B2858